LELQHGAITPVGPGTSCMHRNNSHETVPLTGEEQGLELQNGAITLVGPGTSVIQRNNFHNASLGEMTVGGYKEMSSIFADQ
jgi:hypothetical protein